MTGRTIARPPRPWGQTVIYEAHVRGPTLLHPQIPASAARQVSPRWGDPAMIAHFKRLGITRWNCCRCSNIPPEPRLQRLGLINYWGYNVLAPYAPDNHASLSTDATPLNEFRDAVKALHKAGIEVILDVVFNHSAESWIWTGRCCRWSGIDNLSYYWLTPEGDYVNDTGCGNTLRLDQLQGVAWVMDCLRFWVRECHVDGFRFDLGSVLGRIAGVRSRCAAVPRRCWRTMCCRAAS